MKVSFNSEEVKKQLEAYHKEAILKLRSMVQTFVYNVTVHAINTTPIGQIPEEGTESYQLLYARRKELWGLREREGFAKGSWSVDTVLNQSSFTNTEGFYGGNAGTDAAEKVFFDDLDKYRLGHSLYITNTGPYIAELEANSSQQTNGQGIVQPTLEAVKSIYQMNLASYYKRDI